MHYFVEFWEQILLSRKRTPPMTDYVMRQHKPPQRLGQKGEPIAVGDKVKARP